MLVALDILFHVVHLAVIAFNLFGWVSRRTRRLHRWCVGITAFCWLGAGIWVGKIGYCPLTDWHWQIKRQRGETALPSSYIDFLLQNAGFYADPTLIDIGTGLVFAIVTAISLFLFWKERKAVYPA